jgi:hypothetical protein
MTADCSRRGGTELFHANFPRCHNGTLSMKPVVTLLRPAFCAALFAGALALPLPALALECAKDPVSARGLGFTPSPEASFEAAKEEWLKKAQTVFSDAKWETAQKPDMYCATQGLYSNCKVTAIPCGTTPAAPKAEK